jgi:TM2 domain-containing membrane protein YozV
MSDQTNNSSYSLSISGDGKNLVIAYVLWWFLGFIGLHRIYLEKKGTGITFIILFILGFVTLFIAWIPLGIWWLLDAYFVYQYVKEANPVKNASELLSIKVDSGQNQQIEDKVVSKHSIEMLERLHGLYEKGAISKEEYETQKKSIL